MNVVTKISVALLLGLFASLPLMAKGPMHGAQTHRVTAPIQQVAPLTADETRDLLWVREEEKLARDTYMSLYKIWGAVVFKNIAASEQKHMDAILKKLNLFGLPDPAQAEIGLFTDQNLQSLYGQLNTQGRQSIVEALRVGATIEDMDIRDLMNAVDATSNLALKTTYQNLLEGSKKHLRAFVGLLRAQGSDYSPQFIDEALFDAILGV